MKFFASLALLGLCSALPLEPRQSKEGPVGLKAGSKQDVDEAMRLHNKARSDVNHKPLAWDAKLASDAAAYAKVIAGMNSLTHSGVAGQGENLFQGYGGEGFAMASYFFAKEKGVYPPGGGVIGRSGGFEDWGHYSQMIWPSTTKVGMGWAKGQGGTTWVVARYSPSGNITGKSAKGGKS